MSSVPGNIPTVITGYPKLVLLPTAAASLPSWLEAAGTSANNRTLYLEYGKPASLSLAPCATLAAANSSAAATCAVVAFDSKTGGDLSGLISVEDVSRVAGQARCVDLWVGGWSVVHE